MRDVLSLLRRPIVISVSAAILALGTGLAEDNSTAPATAAEVEALREEVEHLRRMVEQQQNLIEQLQQRDGNEAHANAAPAAPEPASVTPAPKPSEALHAPLFFRIGGAEFTPGGFLDITSIYRSTNVGSGIGTSFGNIPLSTTPAGRVGETRFSAQNSRIALKVTANPGRQAVTGYLEADFLGTLPANGNVTSNSNSMRMRLYWVDVRRGKWEVLGGQSWSLLTPNRHGLSAMPPDIFYTQDMDTNYQVGLTWSRDPQFRLVYHANRNWTAAFSVENPQQYTGSAVAFPSSFYTSSNQFDNGSNLSTPNQRPDVIAKVAFDGQAASRAFHLELAGLSSGFRSVTPAGRTFTAQGYGGAFNANLELVKHFRLIADSYLSEGGGRYLFGLGPDVVVRPDGSLSPVRAGSGIAGLEYQATPSSLWYGYYGGAYFWRNYSVEAPGQYAGFGFPGSPLGANRSLQEGTFGLIRTFWKNPNYGALQLITQYSYLTRSPWALPAGTPHNPHTHMVYGDLRYVLP